MSDWSTEPSRPRVAARPLAPIAPEELDRMQRAAEDGVSFPAHEVLRLVHTIRTLRLRVPEEHAGMNRDVSVQVEP